MSVAVPPLVYSQIDMAVLRVTQLVNQARHSDLSDLPDEELLEARTMCMAAVESLSPAGSEYRRAALEAISRHDGRIPGEACRELAGILKALRGAYVSGFLRTVEGLIAADMFGDFLDMSAHLLDAGYKDPAAVIAGAVLEEHLRKLTQKHNGALTDAQGRPLKADTLNAALVKSGEYGTLEQKDVTAWLGLRNHAAHGEFDKYQAGQVQLMLDGIRAFVVRHP